MCAWFRIRFQLIRAAVLAVIIFTGLWWLAALWQNTRETMLAECEYDRRTRCPTDCALSAPTIVRQNGAVSCWYRLDECSGIVDAGGAAYSSSIRLGNCNLAANPLPADSKVHMRLYFRHTATASCPDKTSPVRYDGQLGTSDDPHAMYDDFPDGGYCSWPSYWYGMLNFLLLVVMFGGFIAVGMSFTAPTT